MRLDIPSIGVHTSLMQLGLNPDRTVQVPPIQSNSPAGWYQFSPTPGQLGPSVILGHVTLGNFGDGVFFRLAALHTGDRVEVSRADGSVAVFSVDQTAEYPKEKFPSQAVYGNIDHAGLRLITCGGTKNTTTHAYPDNVVVYASLVSATSASA
ncbi:class F sortase [Streptantibioticus ferralitis]|uniref:Class F sortase n=1 Tax=Streptantibioticus ferralitis TaxID=236510 RepID=A0ABT5YXG1_9ACTN|nr:class F sortase [Streptantibioticus ferralitis]MDF2256097.1 class F sortase [Streptantibioticus ferralitis]